MGRNMLYNSLDYLEDDYSWEVELDKVIKKNVKKLKKPSSYLLVTQRRSPIYGRMGGHGKRGYKHSDENTIKEAILSVDHADSFELIDDNGILKIAYHDHDGYDLVTLKRVTKSNLGKLQDLDNYASVEDVLAFAVDLTPVKVK